MKKLIASLLILCFLIAFLPQGVFGVRAASTSGSCGANGDNLTWSFNASSGLLTISGSGEMANWDFASPPWDSYCASIKTVAMGSAVTSIGDYAFYNCTELSSVSIPDSVTSIGYSAFYGCTGLRTVALPDSVRSIGCSAFRSCEGLSSVTIPDSVSSIGHAAFYNTGYYNDSANWIDNVLYMGKHLIAAKYAISGHYSVREGTLTIAGAAFEGRTGLSSVTIPNSVVSIGHYAFESCVSLSSIILPDSVSSIGSYAFHKTDYYDNSNNWSGNVLYIGKHLIEAKPTLSGSYTVQKGTLTIADFAFEACKSLSSVSLPNSVRFIGSSAFYGCIAMKKLCIENPSCEIYDSQDPLALAEDAVICGQPSSTAEAYAQKYGYIFYRLCQCTDYACDYHKQLVQISCTEAYARFTCRKCGYSYKSSVTPTGHSYSVYSNNGADHSVKCALCDSMYTEAHSFKDGPCICGAVAPTLDADIAIYHSLDLASSISMNYAVPAALLEKYDSYYLEALIPKYEGNELVRSTTVRIDPVSNGGYEYFTLSDLTAIQMGDVVEATLHMEKDGEGYISNVDSYSIANYALSQLNKANAPDSLKKLCADLLYYGAQTQLFKCYRTDAPADALMTEVHRAYLTDAQAVPLGNTNEKLNDLADPSVTWVGTSLNLESRIALKYVFAVANYTGELTELTLHISYTDIHGEKKTVILTDLEEYNPSQQMYAFSFNGLLAAELRCVLEAAVYAEDDQISETLRYSPDTYGSNKPEQLKYLCKALMAYSDSAKAYFFN